MLATIHQQDRAAYRRASQILPSKLHRRYRGRSIVRQREADLGGKSTMKAKILFPAVALALFAMGPVAALSQSVGQDMKNAGHDTADASKKVAHKTEQGTKTAAKDTEHGTKVAAHKTAEGTKTVAHDTEHGATVATHKTEQGTKTVAHDTAQGTKTAAHKTEQGTKTAAHETAKGTKTAANKTKDAVTGKPE
jgi:hypothetical protein